MANSSNFPPIEPIHSFRDDSSTYSIESRDGVVTQDQSMDTSMTTDSVRRDRVKEWLNSTEDQQDKMQRAAIDPVLQYISNDPKVAQLVYESSSFKKILKDFIKEGQEHAQAIREQVPNDIIQCENTTSISFSDATRPRLESDMKVKFKDATPLFTNNALKNFPSEDRLVTFSNYWEMHGGHERFLEWLDLTMLYTPQSVEAGSRCTIDIIFLGLAHILKLWKYDVVHIPELKVRSGPLVPVFSVAGDPPTKVILNGSVDYAIVTRFLGSETGNPTGKTQDLLDRLTISQDAITLFKNDTVQHKKYKLHILFVEAKKPPPTVTRQYIQDPIKWLRKHEGQAVAEAIAGLRCQQLVDMTLKEEDFLGLPWALTDGVNWLFGIVVHKYERTGSTGPPGHLNSQWTSYELTTAENDRRQTNIYPGLIRLMQILLFFSVHTPEEVFMKMAR